MRKVTSAILLAAAAFSGAAHASALVLEAPFATPVDFYKFGYGANPELDRAWLVLGRLDWNDDQDKVLRVHVPGLRFDTAISAVVLEDGERQTVCAEAGARGFGPFRGEALIPTGHCQLRVERVRVPVDDGFVVHEMPRTRVVLDAASAAVD